MDANQLTYFKARYADMTEEELALLVATRRDVLSEEAAAALTDVLRRRNLPNFIDEVNDIVDDLNGQSHVARLEVERHRQHNQRARKAMVFFVFFAIGLALFVNFLRL